MLILLLLLLFLFLLLCNFFWSDRQTLQLNSDKITWYLMNESWHRIVGLCCQPRVTLFYSIHLAYGDSKVKVLFSRKPLIISGITSWLELLLYKIQYIFRKKHTSYFDIISLNVRDCVNIAQIICLFAMLLQIMITYVKEDFRLYPEMVWNWQG